MTEDYKRENYMIQKEMSELNERYKKRYETDVLELQISGTIYKYSIKIFK